MPIASYSTLRRQAQLARVLAFKTGVAVSARPVARGIRHPCHRHVHDPDHEWLLANLTDSVDYLWDYAEEHGVADRMVVVIGSDFGRTNFYNSDRRQGPLAHRQLRRHGEGFRQRWTGPGGGRDRRWLHFAYMERYQPAHASPRRQRTGTIIYPKHVHKALRRYLGIANTPGAKRFPFNNTEDFAFAFFGVLRCSSVERPETSQ